MESASNVGEMRHEIRLNKEEKRRFLNGLRNAVRVFKKNVLCLDCACDNSELYFHFVSFRHLITKKRWMIYFATSSSC